MTLNSEIPMVKQMVSGQRARMRLSPITGKSGAVPWSGSTVAAAVGEYNFQAQQQSTSSQDYTLKLTFTAFQPSANCRVVVFL